MRAVLILATVLAVGAPDLAAQGAEAASSHERAAAELLEVMNLEQMTLSSIEVMTDAMVQQNPALGQVRDVLLDFFKEFMRWEDLKPQYVRLYRDAYTESELRELIAFYRTPLGQKTLQLTPRLMREGAVIGQKQIEPHLPELDRRIQARLRGGL